MLIEMNTLILSDMVHVTGVYTTVCKRTLLNCTYTTDGEWEWRWYLEADG